MMWKHDGPTPRWFTSKEYAITWCRMCGFNPDRIEFDHETPKLELVHGSVYKRKETI